MTLAPERREIFVYCRSSGARKLEVRMPKSTQVRYEDSLLYRIRHSTAHIMAQAVLEKFPDAKIAIGPAIEDGFYYDFDLGRCGQSG